MIYYGGLIMERDTARACMALEGFPEDVREMVLLAAEESPWIYSPGPRGGKRWQNSRTGAVTRRKPAEPRERPGDAAVPDAVKADTSSLAFEPNPDALPVRGWNTRKLLQIIQGPPSSRVRRLYNNHFLTTAQDTGFATNGRFMFRLKPEEQALVNAMPNPGDSRGVSKEAIANILAKPVGDVPSVIRGVRHAHPDTGDGGYSPGGAKYLYLVESPRGERVAVDADAVKAVQRRYPDVTLHMTGALRGWEDSPVILRSGGQAIGAIMPLPNKDGDGPKHRLRGESV